MTDDLPLDPPQEDAALAAEYALGLLQGPLQEEAHRRMGTDAHFAARVRRWQEDFSLMALALDPVPPSRGAKAELMKRLFPARKRSRALLPGLLAALAAFAMVVYLVVPPPQDPGPSFIAELQPAERSYLVTAALRTGETAVLDLTRDAGAVAPDGRATELWAILPDQAPISLGLVPEDARWSVILPEALARDPAQLTLALSDEPAGGSPTGAPTGAVLAAVPLVEL